jgi:hypothetical protein
MLSILIGCAETPIDPATLLSMVKVYGYCAVAAKLTSDTSDANYGKVIKENLALALDQCDKDILCLALKCKDAQASSIFDDINDINEAANSAVTDTIYQTSEGAQWEVPEGALDMTGENGDTSNPFPSEDLLAQLKKYKTDACCLCYNDIYALAGGRFDSSTPPAPNMQITSSSGQTEIEAALTVAHNMWALCPQTNNCHVMEEYFGEEGLWFLYPCPHAAHRGPHKGKYEKKECLNKCPKLTPAEVLDTVAYNDIVGTFSTQEPAFYNTLVGYTWTVRGSCSFDSSSSDDIAEQRRWREVAFMFCHVSVEEFCCAIEQERNLYLNNVGGSVTYPDDMHVSEWANAHFDELPSEVLACADKITLLQKYDPTHEITLADITRVCPGLNMCELIKLVSSLEVLADYGCQPLVVLSGCVKVITYKDVVEGGDYAPQWQDDDVVASANDLVCVANAINLQSYFVESQPCVKDTNECVAEITADSLLNLTFIDGVFASEGHHRNGKRDDDYESPKCRKFSCECYESPEKFRCALAGLYVYNSASYVVSNKISAWTICTNTSAEESMIDVSTIVVDTADTFKVFKRYDVHARDEPMKLIHKVAPHYHGLVATIATVRTVDGSDATSTKADDNLAFFLSLANHKDYGFGKTLEAYQSVYKTGRGDGAGNSYSLTAQGGQRVQPANFGTDTNGDCGTCYTDFSAIIVSILTCGPAAYRKELLGKYKAITKDQLSLLDETDNSADGDLASLAGALFSLVQNKICAQSITEVFTIECDSVCENQTRVYKITKEAFKTSGTSADSAQTYILRQVSQTYPLKSIIEYIGIYVLVQNLDDNFAQTVINRFPLCDVVGCHTCEGDSTELEVSFDDVVFIIDSYAIDEYGCLTSCQSLPWPLADYEECFGNASDNCSNGSHGSGHHSKQDIRHKIENYLNGRSH